MIRNEVEFDNNIILSQRLKNKSIKQFCRPKLKSNFMKDLLETRPNKKISKIGCTDSSDGLFQAIQDLSIASNCKAIIDYEKIPKDKDWPKGEIWDKYYVFGGEDYELVFSLQQDWAEKILNFDKGFKAIGYFTDGKGSVEFKNPKNNKLLDNKPFKHF